MVQESPRLKSTTSNCSQTLPGSCLRAHTRQPSHGQRRSLSHAGGVLDRSHAVAGPAGRRQPRSLFLRDFPGGESPTVSRAVRGDSRQGSIGICGGKNPRSCSSSAMSGVKWVRKSSLPVRVQRGDWPSSGVCSFSAGGTARSCTQLAGEKFGSRNRWRHIPRSKGLGSEWSVGMSHPTMD